MAKLDEFDDANARAAARLKRGPVATGVRYDRRIGRIVVALSSGLEIAFSPRDAQGLDSAKPADLDPIEVSPSGLGLHFPKLDVDLYIPALLEGFLGTRRWAARRLGEQGGRSKSDTKAAAARSNGRLGGRPKKTFEPA